MPKKKAPAKKAAAKKPAKKAKKAVKKAAPPPPPPPPKKKVAAKKKKPAPGPKVLGRGFVSLQGPGRLLWVAQATKAGVRVLMAPSGVSRPPRRISLSLWWDREMPAGGRAMVAGSDIVPKVDRHELMLNFIPLPGWQKSGIVLDVEGVEGAPDRVE